MNMPYVTIYTDGSWRNTTKKGRLGNFSSMWSALESYKRCNSKYQQFLEWNLLLL